MGNKSKNKKSQKRQKILIKVEDIIYFSEQTSTLITKDGEYSVFDVVIEGCEDD